MHGTEATSPNLLQVTSRHDSVLLAMSICVVGRRGGRGRERSGYCVVCVCVSVNPLTSDRAGAEGSPMLLLPKLRVVRVVFLRRAFRIG